MLRIWLILAGWLAWTGEAMALSPAEHPPEGFTARQYIDSKGCVFTRDQGGDWQARLARDGARICGYPPTLSLREAAPAPPGQDLAKQDGVEAELAARVAIALGPSAPAASALAEIKGDHTQPADGPAAAIAAELASGPAVRSAMTGAAAPHNRLCDLLGSDPQAAAPAIGQDPTLGYCGALRQLDLPAMAKQAPAGTPPKADGAAQPEPSLATATLRPSAAAARQAPKATLPAQTAPRVKTPAPQNSGRDMIPAGARFVQVGIYGDPANASRAAAQIVKMGLPVVESHTTTQGKPARIIMAGPFNGREPVVVALNQLRNAGFRDAYARR